jgi:hypothetical protein
LVGWAEVFGLLLCIAVLLADACSLMLAGGGERPATLFGLPLDDVWIHLSYARSLAETGHFGWNPGTWENGVTAPLWAILLALPLKLGMDPVLAAKGLSLLSGVVAVGLLWAVGREVGGPKVALIACVAFVLEPWSAVLAVSGMEALAASGAALAAVLLGLRGLWRGCGLALAIAGLLRPELGLMVFLALVLAPNLQARLSVFVPPALAGGAWMVFGLVASGHPLPGAFRTKVHAGFDPFGQLASLGGLFSAGPRELGVVGGLLLLATLVFVLRGVVGATQRRAWATFLVVLPLGLVGFYVVALPLGASADPLTPSSVQSLYYARYLLVVMPWLALLGAMGWIALWAATQSRAWRCLLVLVGCSVLVGIALTERSSLRAAYIANNEEIEVLHGGMVDWIAANLPADAVVGVSDAGRLRFGVQQRLIDLTGLNSSALLAVSDRVPLLFESGLTHAAIWPAWHRALLEDHRLRWTRLGGTKADTHTVAAYPVMVLYRVELR